MQNKITRLIRFIDFGIFPGTVCFSVGFTIPELIEQFGKKKYKDYSPYLTAFKDRDVGLHEAKFLSGYDSITEGKNVTNVYFIVLKDRFLFRDESYVILAHEVLHICQFFLKRILVREKEIEAEAYLHSYIMQKCLDALRGKDLK